ncbi:PH domain-containing protein [Saccharothrix sp. Mg75]|uniref:PH domain-containing protein n=1 Tax=Saccharothrix sp. Mg75 TaxID=3445357 RepID=UPI003EF01BE8
MSKVVFRIPTPALLAAALTVICATPIAWAAPGLQAIYLLPAAFAVWVVRNRTTVDGERIVARSTFGERVVPWSGVKAVKVVERGWLSAVLTDGSLVRLPAVRAGHLPALALVSGGRLPNPAAAEEGPATAPEPTAVASSTGPGDPASAPGGAASGGPDPAAAAPDREATPPSVQSDG